VGRWIDVNDMAVVVELCLFAGLFFVTQRGVDLRATLD
jgi:hypothetical protein